MVLFCHSFGNRSERPRALQLLIKMLIRCCLKWEEHSLLYRAFVFKGTISPIIPSMLQLPFYPFLSKTSLVFSPHILFLLVIRFFLCVLISRNLVNCVPRCKQKQESGWDGSFTMYSKLKVSKQNEPVSEKLMPQSKHTDWILNSLIFLGLVPVARNQC